VPSDQQAEELAADEYFAKSGHELKEAAVIQQETMLEIADNSGVKNRSVHPGAGQEQCRLPGKCGRVTASIGILSVWRSRSTCPTVSWTGRKYTNA